MRDFLVGWVEISLKFQLRDVPDFRQMARLLPFSRGSRPSFNHTAGPSTTWCAFACGTGPRRAHSGDCSAGEGSHRKSQSGKLQLYFAAVVRFGCNCRFGAAGDKADDRGAERRPVEFEPARNYLCYLRYDSVVFYSGYTSNADTLEDQVTEVLNAVSGARAISGALTQDFGKTGRLSVFLHRSQKLSVVKDLLSKVSWVDLGNVEFRLVDGFAGEKYLLEIEATALSG